MSDRVYLPAGIDGRASLKKGLDVPCPRCGPAGDVYVSCGDVSRFYCLGCHERFDAAAVREFMDQVHAWAQILAWAQTAPTKVPG